jgi:hypothetical protein
MSHAMQTPQSQLADPAQWHALEPLQDSDAHGLASFQRAVAALLQAMRGPDLQGRMQALMHRLDNGLATREDRVLLRSLPLCQAEPEELVRLFARQDPTA